MEQEHGTDAAAICKGVLLRIGMAAAMSTAVLGFLSYHVLPRLRKTDYIKMVSDADAQTALTLAPLVLLAICCLCVYPLIGHGKRSRTDVVAVACTVASFVLLGAGLVNMAVEKTMTPPLTVSIFLFCLMLAHTNNRRHEGDARMGRPRRQDGPRTTHVHLGRDRLRGGTDRSLESVM